MQLVFQSQFSGRDACGRQREEHSMGFLDKLKNKSGGIKDMASDAVDKHGDKIGDGLAKTKDIVDDKTGGQLGSKGDAAVDQATDAHDKLDGKDDENR